jgi:hypothetical protein
LLKKVGVFTVCILALSCDSPFSVDPFTLEKLLSAPEQIQIDSRSYRLEASLWRDFMPSCPPDGKPLTALILVTAIDQLPFPANVDADKLWIINGQQVWETEFSDEEIVQDPNRRHQLEKVARDGPKWGPDIYVEVVVKVKNYNNSNSYLLRASNQYIGATY